MRLHKILGSIVWLFHTRSSAMYLDMSLDFCIYFQGEGEFKGLEGIAVNSKGNTLVADRENHRVQIF